MTDTPLAEDTLTQQISATELMLATHKNLHTQKLVAGDDEAAISELEGITRLEVRLASLKQFARLREATRERETA